jgi:Arc/MetJ-type ribon-helix-helix transcriptional regulator
MKNKHLVCDRCEGTENVALTYIDFEERKYCDICRQELFGKKNKVGRPSLGVTKKISLTMAEHYWEWLDEEAKGNRSAFVRDAVIHLLAERNRSYESDVYLGYLIKGLRELSYSEEEIIKIATTVGRSFKTTQTSIAQKLAGRFNHPHEIDK